MPKGPFFQNVALPPAGFNEGGDQQGIKPGDEAEHKPGDGPGLVSPVPVEPTQKCRTELGGGGKRNQPHIHEHVGFTDHPEIEIAEKNDQEDPEPFQIYQENGKPAPGLAT